MEMSKTGLVLEGGAMRGLFSAGVIDVMMEHGLCFDGVIGVSAGAAFGCNYKSHQPGRVLRYNQLMARDRRYSSIGAFIKTGDLFNSPFCYHYVPTHIDVFDTATYNADPTDFQVVCTDVLTGGPVYKKLPCAGHEAFEWIRASASMPLASRIVEIGNYKLLDGGVADSIPLQYFQKEGYKRCIVVLTQPLGYRKKKLKVLPLVRIALRKYPNMVHAMARRHIMYNRQLDYVAQEEQEGRALVIRPPFKLPIGHLCHDPKQMEQVHEIGRQTALTYLQQIKDFLKQ